MWMICCCQPIFSGRLSSWLFPTHLSYVVKSRLSWALLPTHLDYGLFALLLPTHLPKKRVGNSHPTANSTVQAVHGRIRKQSHRYSPSLSRTSIALTSFTQKFHPIFYCSLSFMALAVCTSYRHSVVKYLKI